jgi:hypothetical protein
LLIKTKSIEQIADGKKEKFTPGSATSSAVTGSLKASRRALYAVGAATAAAAAGVLCDRRRKVFCYGLLVSSTALCAISTSFSSLLEQILFSLFSFAPSGYKFPALPLFRTSSRCAT